jgi:GT2 family glycosyltransferase
VNGNLRGRDGKSMSQPATAAKSPPDTPLPSVSIIVVSYNGRAYLEKNLASLQEQTYANCEIILVDNGSTDASVEFVNQRFPDIKTIQVAKNAGFGHANNLGAQEATGEYLLFLNQDTVADSGFVHELATALHRDPGVGLATGKILLLSQPDRINTCGNDVHFTGIPVVRGWMLESSAMNVPESVCSVSGAAFMIRRSLFDHLGGFDGEFFLYLEDNDLSWRAQLAGHRSWYIPSAVIYHEYEPRFGPEKFYYMERNRLSMLLKNLRWGTLFVLLPSLLLSELLTWGYAFVSGSKHVAAKLRGYGWVLGNVRRLQEKRQSVQSIREAADRSLLKHCSYRPDYGLAHAGPLTRIAGLVFDPLFYVAYHLCLLAIRW